MRPDLLNIVQERPDIRERLLAPGICEGVSPHLALAVLRYRVAHANSQGTHYEAQGTVAKQLLVSRQMVHLADQALERAGLLRRTGAVANRVPVVEVLPRLAAEAIAEGIAAEVEREDFPMAEVRSWLASARAVIDGKREQLPRKEYRRLCHRVDGMLRSALNPAFPVKTGQGIAWHHEVLEDLQGVLDGGSPQAAGEARPVKQVSTTVYTNREQEEVQDYEKDSSLRSEPSLRPSPGTPPASTGQPVRADFASDAAWMDALMRWTDKEQQRDPMGWDWEGNARWWEDRLARVFPDASEGEVAVAAQRCMATVRRVGKRERWTLRSALGIRSGGYDGTLPDVGTPWQGVVAERLGAHEGGGFVWLRGPEQPVGPLWDGVALGDVPALLARVMEAT